MQHTRIRVWRGGVALLITLALSLWGCSGDDDKSGPSCTSSADCGEGQVCFLPAGSSGIPTTGIPIEANQEDGSGDGSSSSGSSDGPGFCATSQQASSSDSGDNADNVDNFDGVGDLTGDATTDAPDMSCTTTLGSEVADGDFFCEGNVLMRCDAGTTTASTDCNECVDTSGLGTACIPSEDDPSWPGVTEFPGPGCFLNAVLICEAT